MLCNGLLTSLIVTKHLTVQEESVNALRQGPPPGFSMRFADRQDGHDWSRHLGRSSPLPLAPPDPTSTVTQVRTVKPALQPGENHIKSQMMR